MTDTAGVGRVHLTPAQLHQMAVRCDDTGQELATGMAQLIQRIESLPGAGAAYGALMSVSQELNDGMRQILTALDTLGQNIRSVSDQVNIGDTDAGSQIRRAAATTGDGGVVTILNGRP